MKCPSCNERTELKEDLYFCRKCGAYENKDRNWMKAGRIISAPELEKASLERAKKNSPTGDWKE